MAHYDAREIIDNIERVLLEREAREEGLAPDSMASIQRPQGLQAGRRSVLDRLDKGPLARMREVQGVDRVPESSRMRFFKKVLMRVLRIVSAPQSAYNYENLETVQVLAREVDTLRETLRRVEDGATRPFGQSRMSGAEDARLRNLVQQHLTVVQDSVGKLTNSVEEISRDLTQLVDNVSTVSSRLGSLGVRQQDVYTEVTAARLDVGRLWTELGLVYESIDQRAEDLWQGLEERDVQLLLNTEAAQSLHNQVSGLETVTKEVRARLLALTEQLSIHQEMIETLRTETSSLPAPQIRAVSPARRSPEEPRDLQSSADEGAPPSLERRRSDEDLAMVHRQLDLAYLRFQRQYRADEAELRSRQREYISLLASHLKNFDTSDHKPRLLDLACGDGIFIELLIREGWDATGVDLNESMVKQGRSRDLPIEQGDAIEYLERLEPRSYDVISMFQFVEHLSPPQLMLLLKRAYRVLRPQGVLLIETINPHSLMALRWFHLDLTHQRLIFPEMLQLLAETAGFLTVDWKGVNPVTESNRLKLAGSDSDKGNLRKLNEFLFGDQDYYFLARKPGAPEG